VTVEGGDPTGGHRRDDQRDAPRADPRDAMSDATRDAVRPAPGGGAPGAMPDWIGDYRIVGKLGEGGMGVVYAAEQQDPKRTVALKVIRGGAAVDETQVRMFQREVETLARLQHPDIASIHASGRTADGLHWFAMELVEGPDLAAWLAARPKAITPGELRLRLRLCARIAHAVHHAHQRGVIHRDLKPSNIIVTEAGSVSATASHAGLPQVKILDFGLARLTDEDLKVAEALTVAGAIKGTLPYMSPEQARGAVGEIDVRTDVYALGIVLYEILAGQRPYDMVRASLLEAVRVICEEQPRPIAASWSGTRRLDGDVETIVGKALEKEPGRRYASAAALAEDIERYLDSQPIMARPPSALYQARKLAQRHRPLVLGIAATSLAVIAGLVVSTLLYVRAERERRTATQTSRFLGSMLEGVGPSVAQGRDTTLLREILQRTTERIDKELAGDPEVEAHLRNVMGIAYHEIADLSQAQTQWTRSLELYRGLRGDEHLDVAQQHAHLGLLAEAKSDYAGAEQELRRAVEIAQKVAPDATQTFQIETSLANALVRLARYDDARAALAELYERQKQALGPSHADIAVTLNSLGNACQHLGQLDDASAYYAQALEMHRQTLGDKHPFVATDIANSASVLDKRGKFAEAEAAFKDALSRYRALYPDGHEMTAAVLSSLSSLLQRGGRYDEAGTLSREALAITEKLYGQKSAPYARALDGLGIVLGAKGDAAGSDEAARRALEIRREVLGSTHPTVAASLNNVGMRAFDGGRYEEAEDLLREAYEMQRGIAGPDDQSALTLQNNLGRAQQARGDLAGAEKTFREVIERREKLLGKDSVYVAVTQYWLSQLRRETGRPAEAEPLAREAARIMKAALGPSHNQTFTMEFELAEVLIAQRHFAEARALAQDVEQRAVAAGAAGARTGLEAQVTRARALSGEGRHADALALLDTVLTGEASVFSDTGLAAARIARGVALAAAGRTLEARAELDAVRTAIAAKYGPEHRLSRRAARELEKLGR